MTETGKSRCAQDQIAAFYRKHCHTVYRVCFSYLKNEADAADIMQEVFLKWITCKNPPSGDVHETAWLVTTAGNLCKNHLRSWKYRLRENSETLDSLSSCPVSDRNAEVLDAVLSLPDKYKTAVYLYYYEGFETLKIAEATGQKHSTVRSHLKRARDILRQKLGDE